MPVELVNSGSGSTYGVELSGNWKVNPRWSLTGGYTWLVDNIQGVASPTNPSQGGFGFEGGAPHTEINLRSHVDLPHKVEFDTGLYYVSELEVPDPVTNLEQIVPSYVRLDLRIGRRFANGLEVSVGGQNLLQNRHQEFVSTVGEQVTYIPRTFYVKLTYRM
jgi:iron complex outermembrane receptor protein